MAYVTIGSKHKAVSGRYAVIGSANKSVTKRYKVMGGVLKTIWEAVSGNSLFRGIVNFVCDGSSSTPFDLSVWTLPNGAGTPATLVQDATVNHYGKEHAIICGSGEYAYLSGGKNGGILLKWDKSSKTYKVVSETLPTLESLAKSGGKITATYDISDFSGSNGEFSYNGEYLAVLMQSNEWSDDEDDYVISSYVVFFKNTGTSLEYHKHITLQSNVVYNSSVYPSKIHFNDDLSVFGVKYNSTAYVYYATSDFNYEKTAIPYTYGNPVVSPSGKYVYQTTSRTQGALYYFNNGTLTLITNSLKGAYSYGGGTWNLSGLVFNEGTEDFFVFDSTKTLYVYKLSGTALTSKSTFSGYYGIIGMTQDGKGAVMMHQEDTGSSYVYTVLTCNITRDSNGDITAFSPYSEVSDCLIPSANVTCKLIG